MEIIYKKTSELVPYEKNPRKNDDAVKYVAESIKQFGFKVPIIIDKNDVIIAGHTRLKAAEKLNLEEVPCIIADDLTKEQVDAYRLADNRVAEFSTWDEDMLNEELRALESDFDLNALGFEDFLNNEEPLEVKDDEFDIDAFVPEEPVAKLGDIYQLGEHRLMCGDSTKQEDVEKLMDGNKADMVFTDPPYGMDLDTDFSGMQNHLDFAKEKGFTGGKKYEQGIVDVFNPKMIDLIMSLNVKETFLWGADYFAELLPNKNDGSWFVWVKGFKGKPTIDWINN